MYYMILHIVLLISYSTSYSTSYILLILEVEVMQTMS